MNKIYDVLIVGAGPAGITLASILKKASFNVAIFEKNVVGGKVNTAPRVDNFPPYKNILGSDLAFEFYLKAKNEQLEIIFDEVMSFNKNKVFEIQTKTNLYYSKILVIASGTSEAKLNLKNEDKFFGKGISYCALCDGHFFKNKDIAIYGGGEFAVKEGIYLAKLAKTLYFINKENIYASNKYIKELNTFNNVKYLLNHEIVDINGENTLENILIKNIKNNENTLIKVSALFPLIRQDSNISFLPKDLLEKDGSIILNNYETKIKNCYMIGDVLPRIEKQIHLAVNDANKLSDIIINKRN